uniref:Protein adenylyltransferase n=1 Tax=Candidatus Kentrum sp. LFY TaxID=2126342 RepID=A0A450WMK9_9GAMM|nr:MAG: Fic family protein [Candidatus Kentron sp. LFY]
MSPVKYHLGGFPPNRLSWEKLIPLIGPANAAIARYEGILHGIPNANVLLSPLTAQEAVLSSRIEGTQATLGEVLEFEIDNGRNNGDFSKKSDIREILNYRAALQETKNQLSKLPLSQRLFKNAHKILMQGVRGRNKSPGEYRKISNWIGPPGCTIEEARFIPCPVNHLPTAMATWEKFLHGEEPDLLVQLALVHAEFESLHPFLDGNGRIGRLIIPLFLFEKELLSSPNFYISEYLEHHRDRYYENLLNVSRTGDWSAWILFFLEALISQAETNLNRARKILDLYDELKIWITDVTHSQHAIIALDWFFSKPIFKTSDFVATSEIPNHTANRILRQVRKDGLLKEIRPSSGRSAAILAFPKLLNIVEGADVF